MYIVNIYKQRNIKRKSFFRKTHKQHSLTHTQHTQVLKQKRE